MKNILILLAGGMMGYGIFLLVKRKANNQRTATTACNQGATQAVTVTETTEYVPAYAAMIGHFDARPEATFAPPKAYVAVSGVNDLMTNPGFVK